MLSRYLDAFIAVDIQNDFCPGGALAVHGGFEIIPVINGLMEHFNLVLATKDRHPRHHYSFASTHGKKPRDVIDFQGTEQILWPDHCVQGSWGAELALSLNSQNIRRVFRKGTDPMIDSYSAFFDNRHRKDTGLADYLRQSRVSHVYLAGLATDYCVKYSALDARKLGFKVFVIKDACRGVNLKATDSDEAVREMKAAGVHVLDSEALLTRLKRETLQWVV